MEKILIPFALTKMTLHNSSRKIIFIHITPIIDAFNSKFMIDLEKYYFGINPNFNGNSYV